MNLQVLSGDQFDVDLCDSCDFTVSRSDVLTRCLLCTVLLALFTQVFVG